MHQQDVYCTIVWMDMAYLLCETEVWSSFNNLKCSMALECATESNRGTISKVCTVTMVKIVLSGWGVMQWAWDQLGNETRRSGNRDSDNCTQVPTSNGHFQRENVIKVHTRFGTVY